MPSGVIYVCKQRKGGESGGGGGGGGGEKQFYKSMYICTPPYPSVIFKHLT